LALTTVMMALALPAHAQDFTLTINAKSGTPMSDLTLGMSPTATDDYDIGTDIPHPPQPPGGFDAALLWKGDRYFIQIIASTAQERTWGVQLQFDGAKDITLTWDNSGLAALGSFVITDAATQGTLLSADMTTDTMVVVDNPALKLLNVTVTADGGGMGGAGGGTTTSGPGGAGGAGGAGGTATGPGGSGGSAAVGGAGGTLGSGGSTGSGGGVTGGDGAGASSGSGSGSGSGTDGNNSTDSGGCSCKLDRSPAAPQHLALWLCLAALCSLRRRRPLPHHRRLRLR